MLIQQRVICANNVEFAYTGGDSDEFAYTGGGFKQICSFFYA
jgi:hypothetical protein